MIRGIEFNSVEVFELMPRTSKKTQIKCHQHQFSLKPKLNTCYFDQIITCSFCNEQNNKIKHKNTKFNTKQCLNCPIFNNDKNYGSPAFILHSQKNNFIENANKLRLEHDKKVQEYTDSKTQLCIPKPRSKHNYCSVCRDNYQDYLEHISNIKHKKKIVSSTFNKYIQDLILKVNPQGNNYQKQLTNVLTKDQDNLNQQPRKKIKTQPQHPQMGYFVNSCYPIYQMQKQFINYHFYWNHFVKYGNPMFFIPPPSGPIMQSAIVPYPYSQPMASTGDPNYIVVEQN